MNKIGIERGLFDDLVRFVESLKPETVEAESAIDAMLDRLYKVQDELQEDNAEIDDCIAGQD